MNYFYNRLNINHLILPCKQAITQFLRVPCTLCGSISTASQHVTLCDGCLTDLPWHTLAQCPQCALPTLYGEKCGLCLQHTPAFDKTFAIFKYAYPVNRLLQQFKYHQQLDLGRLVACCANRLSAGLQENTPDMMVAMPMHHQRLRQRGFNHALEIAKYLEKMWHIPLQMNGCDRIVDTPTQTGMDMKTRTRNLRNAFVSHTDWQSKHILIVDDVMTTGASMHALAKTLKKTGARQISALVIARTLKQSDD